MYNDTEIERFKNLYISDWLRMVTNVEFLNFEFLYLVRVRCIYCLRKLNCKTAVFHKYTIKLINILIKLSNVASPFFSSCPFQVHALIYG